jgi:hypothetical protein
MSPPCTKFDYMLLSVPNMGIARNAVYMLLYTLCLGTAISTIYTPVFEV